MTADFAHLDALRSSLSHESARLAAARKPDEIATRKVLVAQIEAEIVSEIASLARRGIVEPVDEAILRVSRMESNKTALERAFELARSGRYLRLDQLLRRLNSEGYLGEQVTGPAVRKQLSQAIKESRSRPPFSPAASREQRGLGAAMVLLAREQLRALRPILLAPIGPLPPFHASASEWPMLLTLRCSIYIHVWSA